jgi:hypothetical protein
VRIINKIKKITIGVASAGILLANVLPAFAGQPAVQGCLGHDISGYAKNGQTQPADFQFISGAGWGGFISGVAGSLGADSHVGVSGEIHAHQAGFIPDFVIPNSCN